MWSAPLNTATLLAYKDPEKTSQNEGGLEGALWLQEQEGDGSLRRNSQAHWLDFSDENVMNAMKIAHESGIRINDALTSTNALKANAAVITDNVRDFE